MSEPMTSLPDSTVGGLLEATWLHPESQTMPPGTFGIPQELPLEFLTLPPEKFDIYPIKKPFENVFFQPALIRIDDTTTNVSNIMLSSPAVYPTEHFTLEVVIGGLFCLLGLICNILALVVLKKDPKKTTTVYILSALAITDWLILVYLCLVKVIPFLCVYIGAETCYGPLLEATVYIWPVGCMAQTAMIWLVVLVTVDRYIAICHPFKSAVLSTVSNAKKAIAIIWVLAILVNIPRFFYFTEIDHSNSAVKKGTLSFVKPPGQLLGDVVSSPPASVTVTSTVQSTSTELPKLIYVTAVDLIPNTPPPTFPPFPDVEGATCTVRFFPDKPPQQLCIFPPVVETLPPPRPASIFKCTPQKLEEGVTVMHCEEQFAFEQVTLRPMESFQRVTETAPDSVTVEDTTATHSSLISRLFGRDASSASSDSEDNLVTSESPEAFLRVKRAAVDSGNDEKSSDTKDKNFDSLGPVKASGLGKYIPSPRKALGDTIWYRIVYYITFSWLFIYLIPMVTLVVLNIKLTRAIRNAKATHASMVGNNQQEKDSHSATLNIIAVVLVFLVCQTPDFVQVIISYPDLHVDDYLISLMSAISTMFMIINSSVNFFIYCLFYKKFRRLFRRLCCYGGVKDPYTTSSSHKSQVDTKNTLV